MTAAAMQQLVEVRLHGRLGAEFGRVHRLAIDTAAEAVQALGVLCPGFRDAVRKYSGPGFRVRVGRGDRAAWRDQHTLTVALGGADRVDIVPVIHGRKRNGTGQVILGAVLWVVGAVLTAYGYGAVGSPMISAGQAMMIGGAIALLSPQPKGSDSKAKEEASRAINGPANITSAGGPVPLLIGRMLVGSVTISAGLATDQVLIDSSDPGAPDLPYEEPLDWYEAPGGGDGSDG